MKKRILLVLLVLVTILVIAFWTVSAFAQWSTTPIENWQIRDAVNARNNEWDKLEIDMTPIEESPLIVSLPPNQTAILIAGHGNCDVGAGWIRQYSAGHLFILLITNNKDEEMTVTCTDFPTSGTSLGFYKQSEGPNYDSIVGLPIIDANHCGYSCIVADVAHFTVTNEGHELLEKIYHRENMINAVCKNVPTDYVCAVWYKIYLPNVSK